MAIGPEERDLVDASCTQVEEYRVHVGMLLARMRR